MKKQLTIRDRAIGDGQPAFIIAECGVTCNYDMTVAKKLIDTVRAAGADAIKFIFWFPDEIMSDRSIDYAYDTVDGKKTENMYEMLSRLRFSLDEWRELKAYADEQHVIMFCTVNSPGGIAYAEDIGLEAYKLSSWDFNYLPLWRQIAALGKPMLIDTGPATPLEVTKVLHLMQECGNDQCVLLHCFHTDDPREMHMRAIPHMRAAFDCLAGYSSPDTHDETDLMALTLGACVIEKRLTLDRKMPGHHHVLSLEPREFEAYVARVRFVEAALGRFTLEPSAGDRAERRKWFRHLVARDGIPAGTVLTAEMLEGKRPEAGVSPEFLELFVGRKTRRPLERDAAISWDDV